MGKIETHGKRLHTKEDIMEGTYTPEKIDTEGAHTCRDRTEYITYMNLKGKHPMKGMHTPHNIVLMVAVMVKATLEVRLAKHQPLTLDQIYIQTKINCRGKFEPECALQQVKLLATMFVATVCSLCSL